MIIEDIDEHILRYGTIRIRLTPFDDCFNVTLEQDFFHDGKWEALTDFTTDPIAEYNFEIWLMLMHLAKEYIGKNQLRKPA